MKFEWDPDYLSDESPRIGPPISITIAMMKKAIFKMKFDKVAGPSGVEIQIIRAAGYTGSTMIRDVAITIIRDGKVPADWEDSFVVRLYKEKGGMLWTKATIED